MLQGRRQLAAGSVRRMATLAVCVAAMAGHGARAEDATPAASGTTAAAPATMPYWQAPAVPSAVIQQNGAIPPGWQPQVVPYQGIGPDGRPITMYVAPTYVFTYQAGPPVIATSPVTRRAPTGWNYQTQGATPAPVALPPTVVRYQPPPYQFPTDSRALSGTPIVPPATPLPGPQQTFVPQPSIPQPGVPQPLMPQPAPQPSGFVPPPMPQQPLGAPPSQWVPSNAPPPF